MCSKRDIVEIYTNQSNTSAFDVGIVIGEDKQGLVIMSFLEDGKYDNTQYIEKEYIYLKEYDDSYSRAIYDKINFNDIENHKLYFSQNESIKKQVLEYCLKKGFDVSIELYNSNLVDVYGVIVKIQDEEIIINKKNEEDESDGEAYVLDKAISRISFK